MLPDLPGWFAVLLVLVPPSLKWWWGRSLARGPEDPLLPERLQAQRRRTLAAMVTMVALLLVAWPSWSAVTVGLLLVLHLAAGFPLRRVLYQETWSLAAYLGFFIRLNVAVFGLWILIAAAPWIVGAAEPFEAIAAVALGLVLIAWNQQSARVIRRLLRAQTMTDPAVVVRFDALVARTGLTRPRFEYVAMNGGVVANAVALPSLREPGVLLTDTLLSRLKPDETLAICAHELAHLEYYDRARMRRIHAGTIALIVAGVTLTPASHLVGVRDWTVLLLWPVVMAVALVLRARHRQQNETASDLRAVALTGDPEALASGLTRLHAIARVPRRWDQQRERKATHPSLARRIRDIRAHAGAPAPLLAASVTFNDASGSTVATFAPTCVRWQAAPGITQVMDYDALVELRLDVPRSGAPSLVAVDRRKQRWRMTPRADDLASLQAVLDRVDGRLTREVPSPSFSVALAGRTAVKRLGWTPALVAAVTVGTVLMSLLVDLGSASAVRGDMSVTPAVTRTLLTSPPTAVFEIPFNVRVLRLSPLGRLAAVVRETDDTGRADHAPRVFTIVGPRGTVADIDADDLAFVDEAHVLALTARPDRTEISAIDVASATRDWQLALSPLRSGTLTYRAAGNAWTVSGRDESGRLVRASGTIGSDALRATAWPAPVGASSIDGWASAGTSALAVENGTGGRDSARLWQMRGPQLPVTRTMVKTACVSDPAIERRLLCAVRDGRVTRVFAYDAETGAWGGIAVIDAAFEMGEQAAPGWLTGWSNDVPVALRLATGELVEAPRDQDGPPSMLAVSGSMLATATASDLGARIRVYRVKQD